MRYKLICLTHGSHQRDLEATLAAFAEHVHPAPSSAFLHADATDFDEWDVLRYFPWPWYVQSPLAPAGFCAATRACWQAAAAGPEEHVFWLEGDFVIDRDVYLADLALVLDANPTLAQLALMRDAYSDEEKTAGGLFESRPGQYAPREHWVNEFQFLPWLEHRSYFSTNPSLMLRQFMAANPWPTDEEPFCEGRYGIALVERGYSFGVWGTGEPWCRHVGRRDGAGY